MSPVEYCELLLRNCEAREQSETPVRDAALEYYVIAYDLARKVGKNPPEVILDSLKLYKDYLRFNSRR